MKITSAPKNRTVLVLLLAVSILSSARTVSPGTAKAQSQGSGTEQTIWKMEHDYWRYVQENNLPAYLNLWNKSFVGWPSVSAEPVNKDHITDWMTSQTSKGLAVKGVDLKPASIKVTGNIAMTYYWLTYKWQDKDGAGEAHTYRVTHTWVKDGADWRIIGGMSMLEPGTH